MIKIKLLKYNILKWKNTKKHNGQKITFSQKLIYDFIKRHLFYFLFYSILILN